MADIRTFFKCIPRHHGHSMQKQNTPQTTPQGAQHSAQQTAQQTTQPPLCLHPSFAEEQHWATLPPTAAEVRQRFAPARTLGAPRTVTLAQDQALEQSGAYALLQHTLHQQSPARGGSMGHGADFGCAFGGNGIGINGIGSNIFGGGHGGWGTGFLGYALLSTLAQNGLIRAGVETVADEMTRNWVQFQGNNAENDARTKELLTCMERFGLQQLFNKASAQTGYFGGCLAYIDVEGCSDTASPLLLDSATFKKGSLRGFRLIEPLNVSPGRYNATDPVSASYFHPQTWWILGKEYHASRFLYFAANEVPLLLRPSYNFFGIPMAQLACDYVAHFTQTREAAARLLTKFSLTAFKTNLYPQLYQQAPRHSVDARMGWFLRHQSNDGCFVLDKDTEDIVKLDTSLAGVVNIPRQALELLAAVFRVPAVKLLGISPAGFNATGEGDLQNYYDHISSQQQKILKAPLQHALSVLMCHCWGQPDPAVKADFVRPGADDPMYLAEVHKKLAEADSLLLNKDVIQPHNVLARLAGNPHSPYYGIAVPAATAYPKNP